MLLSNCLEFVYEPENTHTIWNLDSNSKVPYTLQKVAECNISSSHPGLKFVFDSVKEGATAWTFTQLAFKM